MGALQRIQTSQQHPVPPTPPYPPLRVGEGEWKIQNAAPKGAAFFIHLLPQAGEDVTLIPPLRRFAKQSLEACATI